jgi:transcriptional regulator with XRE-family HTH domain
LPLDALQHTCEAASYLWIRVLKHLGRIERGEKVPSFELIIALARELNASPSAFFHFENVNVDPKFLSQQQQALLAKRDAKQLQKAFRVLQATLEP